MARHNQGWSEPVSNFARLQAAVFKLMVGSKIFPERMDKATQALSRLSVEDFPEHLRERARRVLSVRRRVAKHQPRVEYWDFRSLSTKERKQFAEDLLFLFSACALDTGQTQWGDIVYPKDGERQFEV